MSDLISPHGWEHSYTFAFTQDMLPPSDMAPATENGHEIVFPFKSEGICRNKNSENCGEKEITCPGVGYIYLFSSVSSSLAARVMPTAGSEAPTWLQLF